MSLVRAHQRPPASDHPKWGPTLSEYMPTFEERLTESFDKYIANEEILSEPLDDLIPLSLLETTLAVGENMHKVGFQSGDRIFPVLISTIRKYTNLYKGGVFDRYYGFLCVRHLIRMVCIGVMRQCKQLDKFLNIIKPEAPWQEITKALGLSTLESMKEALCSGNATNVERLLAMMSQSGRAFTIDGGISYEDAEFLILMLWKARKSLIPLGLAGLLPGLSAMLFVLSQMIVLSKSNIVTRPWLPLQDVIFRCYVGGITLSERELLRHFCVHIESFVLNQYQSISIDHERVDEEDSRTVAAAYCAVFTTPMDLSLASVIQLDIATMLFRWVLELMGFQSKGPLAGEDLVPDVIKSAMARLALEVDREWSGPMLDNRRGFTRGYAAEVFGYASTLVVDGKIPTDTIQEALVQMLVENDFHELTGRILMLITRETSYHPSSLEEFCICFGQTGKAFRILPSPSPEQLASIALTWRKVFLNLMHHDQSSLTRTPRSVIGEAMEAWDALRPPSVRRPPDAFVCKNPRCAIQYIYAGPPEARIVCGRCEEAMYCGPRCQQIHWSLETVDAHWRHCR